MFCLPLQLLKLVAMSEREFSFMQLERIMTQLNGQRPGGLAASPPLLSTSCSPASEPWSCARPMAPRVPRPGEKCLKLLRCGLLWCLGTNLYRCLDLVVSQTKKFWQPHLQSNAKGTNGNKMAGLKMWRAQNAIKEANINIAETGKKQTFSLQAVS